MVYIKAHKRSAKRLIGIIFATLQIAYCMAPNVVQNKMNDFKQTVYNSLWKGVQNVVNRKPKLIAEDDPTFEQQDLIFNPHEAFVPSSFTIAYGTGPPVII